MAYKSRVSDAVVRRLPMYYRHLRDLEKAGVVRISSQELGERMNLTASQIRQDINCFGGFGQQGYGYHVSNLKERIGEILGLNHEYHVIIVGAGNIGRAVANYAGFEREGFHIQAMFDVSPSLVGVDVHGTLVQPMDKLEGWMQAHQVDIAVLSVPASYAQDTADALVRGGVRAIWNFAPVDLVLPDGVAVNNVHLSDSLHILSYRMNEKELFETLDANRRS
ncbi:MAG: redox-sensing transcriptional repressor Rex [Clostridia bacterium]|nr:redox-sensing transcriptional repressor Rex [Clostridia bacterium]